MFSGQVADAVNERALSRQAPYHIAALIILTLLNENQVVIEMHSYDMAVKVARRACLIGKFFVVEAIDERF